MKKAFQVGIIGTGFISELHMEALSRVENVQVTSCCDISKGRAASFANRWNIPSFHTDIRKMLKQETIDVVHVLVPPDYHFSTTAECLKHGVHVFMEKPMCLSSGDCSELIRISGEKDITIGVNHNFLFYPLFQKLLDDLSRNRIGRPEYMVAFYGGPLGQLDFGKFGNWMFREPRNIIFEQGPHPLSQIQAVMGRVRAMDGFATGKQELGWNQFFYDRWEGIAECEKGRAFVHISFGNRHSPQRALYVYGQDGVISVDLLNNRYLVQEKSVFPDYFDPTANAFRYFGPAFSGMTDFFHYALSKLKLKDRTDPFFVTMKQSIAAYYEAMASGNKPPCDGNDGLNIIQACEKWVSSAGVSENPKVQVEATGVSSGEKSEVLVTGGTGFIGKYLVKKLVEQGKRVRILVRSSTGLPKTLRSPLVEIMTGDITNEDTIRNAVKGVKYVFHLAHAIGQTWDDFRFLNIDPTRTIADACLREKVKYFVFTSSIAVFNYGDLRKSGDVHGDSQIDKRPRARNLYARSKIVIENELLDKFKREQLPVVIFKPGLVVGKGGTPYHSGVGMWTRDNVCAYWGWGRNPLPFVLAEDVADAMAKVTNIDGLEGKRFNLVGDIRHTAREYIELLKMYSGRNIKAFPYPTPICFTSDIMKFVIKFAAGDREGLLSYRDLVNRAALARFDCEMEKKTLSWTPCADRDYFNQQVFGWLLEN